MHPWHEEHYYRIGPLYRMLEEPVCTSPSVTNVRSVGGEASITIPICMKLLRLERTAMVVPPALPQGAPVCVGTCSQVHDGVQALSSDNTRGLAPFVYRVGDVELEEVDTTISRREHDVQSLSNHVVME